MANENPFLPEEEDDLDLGFTIEAPGKNEGLGFTITGSPTEDETLAVHNEQKQQFIEDDAEPVTRESVSLDAATLSPTGLVDGPLPRTVSEAVVAAGREGVNLKYSEGLWEDIRAWSDLTAVTYLKGFGLDKMVSGEDKENLRRAIQYVYTNFTAPLADQEKPLAMKNAGQLLLTKARDTVMERLTDLEQRLDKAPKHDAVLIKDLRERQQYLHNEFGYLTGMLNRLDDPYALAALHTVFQTAVKNKDAEGFAKTAIEARATQRDLANVFPHLENKRVAFEGANGEPVMLGKKDLHNAYMKGRGLYDNLKFWLERPDQPNAVDDLIFAAARTGFRAARLQRMGISEEDISGGIGFMGAVIKKYPNLMTKIAQTAAQRVTEQERVDHDLPQDQADTIIEAMEFATTLELLKMISVVDDIAPVQERELGTFERAGDRTSQRFVAFSDRRMGELGNGIKTLMVGGSAVFGVASAIVHNLDKQGEKLANLIGDSLHGDEVEPGWTTKRPTQMPKTLLQQFNDGYVGAEEELPFMRAEHADRIRAGVAAGEIAPEDINRAIGENQFLTMAMLGMLRANTDNALGKLAAREMQNFEGMQLGPEAMGEMAKNIRNTMVDNALELDKVRARMESDRAIAAKALKDGDIAAFAGHVLTRGVTNFFWNGYKESVGMFAKDPTGSTAAAGALYFMGLGGQNITKQIAKGVDMDKVLVRATRGTRLRHAVKETLAFEPEYANALLSKIKDTPGFLKELSGDRLRTLTAALENISKEGLTDASQVSRLLTGRQLRGNLTKVDRVLRKLPDLDQLLDPNFIPTQLVDILRNPVKRISPIASMVKDLASRLGFQNGIKLSPHIRARYRNVSRQVGRMIDGGANLEEVRSILLPLASEQQVARSVYAKVLQKFPDLNRFFSVQDLDKVSLMNETAKFLSDTAPTAVGMRTFNQLKSFDQTRFLRQMQRKLKQEISELGTLKTMFDEGDFPHQGRLDTAVQRHNRLGEALDAVRQRDWKNGVKLSNNPDLLEEATLGDMWASLTSRPGDGPSAERIWMDIGNIDKTGSLEKYETFRSRMNNLLEQETLMLAGEPVNKAKLLPQLKRAKKRIMEGYYDADALTDSVKLDATTGEFTSAFEARRLIDKRRKIRKMADQFDPENPDPEAEAAMNLVEQDPYLYDPATGYGMEIKPLKTDMQELYRRAGTFDAERYGQMASRVGAIDYGDINSYLTNVRNVSLSIRNSLYAQQLTVKRYLDVVDNLAPEQRGLFRNALRDMSNGDARNLKDWSAKNPKHAARLGLENDEGKVLAAAWEDLESLRIETLTEAKNLGMIPEEAYDKFVKRYSPQLYEVYEMRKYAPEAFKDTSPEALEMLERMSAEDLAEFDLARDHYRWKVLVKRRGQSWIEKKFDSEKAATRFIEENHGLKNLKKYKDKGFAAHTNLGDDVLIVRPLDRDVVDALMPVSRDKALGARVGELIRDVGLWRYMKSIDRPGWVINPKVLSDPNIPVAMRKNFVVVPKQGNKWGPLRGKAIHKKLARNMMDFLEVESSFKSLKASLSEAYLGSFTSRASEFMARGAMWLQGAGKVVRNMIATNMIARSFPTILWNHLWDEQFTARAIAPGYLYEKEGRAAMREAFHDLFSADAWIGHAPGARGKYKGLMGKLRKNGHLRSNIVDPDAPINTRKQILREAIEDGKIGDTMVGSAFTGRMRRRIVETLFGVGSQRNLVGPAKGIAKEVVESVGEPLMNAMRRMGFKKGDTIFKKLKEAFTSADDQTLRLESRLAKITNRLDRYEQGLIDLPEKVRESLVDAKFALENKLGKDVTRFGRIKGQTGELLSYVFGTKSRFGRFGEFTNWSTQFYSRLGNLHRLGIYYYLRKKGVPRHMASDYIDTFMQNYNAMPAPIRGMRENPTMAVLANPVFSFPFEYMRIMKNMAVHNPEFLGGIAALVPSLNTLSLASNGISYPELFSAQLQRDPIEAVQEMSENLLLPTPDGGYATTAIPYMNPLQAWREPSGMLGSVVRRAERDGGAAGTAMNIGVRSLGNFFFQTPILNAAYTMISGKDPFTHHAVEGGMAGRTASAIKSFSRMTTPQWMPHSQKWHNILDTMHRPPSMRTDRMREPIEVFLHTILGVNSRGGIISQWAEGLGMGKQLDSAQKMILRIANLGKDADVLNAAINETFGRVAEPTMQIRDMLVVPKSKGFNENDVVMSLFWATAPMDESVLGRSQSVMADSRVFNAYRTAAYYMDREEPEYKKFGKRMRDEANREMRELMSTMERFSTLKKQSPEQFDAQVEAEQIRTMRRAARTNDLQSMWQDATAHRQASTMVMASTLGVSEAKMEQLFFWTALNENNGMKTWTSAQDLRTAISELEKFIETHREGATGLDHIRSFHGMLLKALPDAEGREIKSNFQNPFNMKIYEAMND